jgi:hypothetical protein
MTSRSKRASAALILLSAPLVFSLSACSSMGMGTESASSSTTASVPRVQDCGIVGIGSPSKFACDGKVYTSFQLAKLQSGSK